MSSAKTKSNLTSIYLQPSISSSSSSTSSFPSPNRINLHRKSHATSSPHVRFSIDHNSPERRRSVTSSSSEQKNQTGNLCNGQKKTCMCSPTTHPGSFRCKLHRYNTSNSHNTTSYQLNRLYARRSAMTNSLVRIGTVEGDLVKHALASLVRPSSHQQRRRGEFHPRPSRLSVMSKEG